MNKSQLIESLLDADPHLRRRDVARAVNAFFDCIIEGLGRGARIEIRGFGGFSARPRDARTARNPKNGQFVELGPTRIPYFRASKMMRPRLNAGASPREAVLMGKLVKRSSPRSKA